MRSAPALPPLSVALGLSALLALTACGDDAAPAAGPDATLPTFGDSHSPPPPPPPDTSGPDTTSPPPPPPPPPSEPPPVVRDPCEGLGLFGRCNGNTAETCVLGTGGASTYVDRRPCGFGYVCTDGFFGPECVSTRECEDGEARCVDFDKLQTCVNGRWDEPWPCDTGECRTNELLGGGDCAAAPFWAYEPYEGRVTIEARGVNDDWTDWSDGTFAVPGLNLIALAIYGGGVIDAALVQDDGTFELEVISELAFPDDGQTTVIGIAAFAVDENAFDGDVRVLTANPGEDRGVLDILTPSAELGPDDSPPPWVWGWRLDEFPSGSELRIRTSEGSGAAYAHAFISLVERATADEWGPTPHGTLVNWVGLGTDWDCGACFLNMPVNDDYANQMFIGGGPDEAYWSVPVLIHEAGHWMMRTYGVPPGEGGTHILGIPQHPGLAWSEGFATAVSGILRGERTYYDKQNGMLFWVDLDGRRYSSGTPWYLPEPAYGLFQLVDENEVARMIMDLQAAYDGWQLDDAIAAIRGPRMTEAPFARGYTRRYPELDADGWPMTYEATTAPAPMFADFLDALMCEGGMSRAAIDGVVQPSWRYPYPSHAPLCDAVRAPIDVRFDETGGGLIATVHRYIPLEEDLVLAFEPGDAPVIIPAGTPPGTDVVVWSSGSTQLVAGGDAPLGLPHAGGPRPTGLRVSTGGEGWGLAGVVPVSTPPAPAPRRLGQRLRFGRFTADPIMPGPLTADDPPVLPGTLRDRLPGLRRR